MTLACAVVCDAVLAVSLRLQTSLQPGTGPGLLGLAVVWLAVLAAYGVVGRLRPVVVGSLTLGLFLAGANAVRMQMLDIPLSFRDVEFLQDPSFLVEMVGVGPFVGALGGLLLMAVLLTVAVRRVGRHRPGIGRSHPRWRWWVAFRATWVAAFVALVVVASGFNQPGNPVRAAFEDSGAVWRNWSQAHNYRANGFVAGLLYNLPVTPMMRPEGYSEERMAEVAQRWRREARRVNVGRDAEVLADTNVVVVLSETMGDPGLVEGVSLEREVLPNIRDLMASDGGHLVAPFFGTGTSAMEFQVLTGQALGLFRGQIQAPYQQFVTNYRDYPSAVGWLRTLGHRAVAVHPFDPGMYRRPLVYRTFGFEKFLSRDDMRNPYRITRRSRVADAAAYEEVLHHVEENADPVLVHLVTMQNHVPFDNVYRHAVEVSGAEGERAELIGQWARGLEHTDKALGRFLGDLEETGERTVVVHFGDHYPSVIGTDQLDTQGLNLLKTPFFVWDSAGGEQLGPQGVVSPTAALELAVRKLGASLPPYFVLLARVQEEIGTVRHDGIVTPEGEQVAEADLTAEQQALLEDLRLVQYDFSIGERYAVGDLWYEPQE